MGFFDKHQDIPTEAYGSTVGDSNNPGFTPINQGETVFGESGYATNYANMAPEKPADFNGTFFDWIDYLAATGQINQGGGGFMDKVDDWATENGWMIPLAMATAGAGAYLGGGAAAAEGAAGAGATTGAAETAGAAGLSGGGAFVPVAGSGASFSIVPGAAYTTAGLGSNALSTADILGSTGFTPTGDASFAIDPTAAYTTAGNAPMSTTDILNSKGFTPTEGSSFTIDPNAAYTTAGKAVSSLSTAQKIAQALKSAGNVLGGSNGSQALQRLATGQTGMGAEIPGIIRGNQNPFLQTAQQQPIQDTRQAQLAKLLKQG